MAYTALQQKKTYNEQVFGKGVGPIQPERHYDSVDHGLKAMALRFLHARCEELGFGADETDCAFHGTSLLPGQIPYNMQMDINRLCLECELEKFIDSGAVEDVYTVYYCYLEMFFGHYGKSKKMVELLSEFESNGSSLLMKHRDHYSHSVYLTYTPFTDDAIPGYMSDEERINDAVSYMKGKYSTSMFDETDEIATVGDLRTAMIDLYGLDRDYVYAINEDMPQENEAYFMPWGWDDGQTLSRDIAVYAAVKVHDPAIVADWSELKDDNGYYPGVRVATAFAEKTGIMTGANRPGDITLGELALILANADRVFETAKAE